LEGVYRQLFNPELFLRAYGKIYRNDGAMTKGTTEETVDGMSLQKIHDIIGLLRAERYQWKPVRRVEIPKSNGKTRPLGIPTWSDKLLQEVLRSLLEAYYEPRFSNLSHGFRPNRGCHSALREVHKWQGTVWFIEGDIKGCFDNIDHTVLLDIIRRDIHDGRLLTLIQNLLKAGYVEDWQYRDSLSGTPQGGIISPLLSNVYLNELDRFVEGTLIPAYTKGKRRAVSPEYCRVRHQLEQARKRGDLDTARQLVAARRKLMSGIPVDPDFRRLRYCRYADDFLLGFIGPKNEAEEIRSQLGAFLSEKLKLTLSAEKTLITHANDDKAKFLGYEICVTRKEDLIADNGTHGGIRATNGNITLLMPVSVVRKYQERYCKKGKPIHRNELLVDTDFTILQRYQAVLRGLYNYYCMANNVSQRMARIWWILETSLAKTLASKVRGTVSEIFRRYKVPNASPRKLQVSVHRDGKEPLVASFGGISLKRIPKGMNAADFNFEQQWFKPGTNRSEAVQRMLAGKCELCGKEGLVEVHHIRKLADIDRPGRRPKTAWEKIMVARKRKTLVVCERCHNDITYGRYDGPSL
jgi:group II intron reverse transcriptase/maturase